VRASVLYPDANAGKQKKVIKSGVPDKDKDKDSKDNADKDDPETAKLKAAISQAIVTETPNVKWTDVAGLEQAKGLLKEVCNREMLPPLCIYSDLVGVV